MDRNAVGHEVTLRDAVRAYPSLPVAFRAQAGDWLLRRLIDSQRVLALSLEGPSGRIWMTEARPGPDGPELFVFEAGLHWLQVPMSADAARAGRAANFELGLGRR